MKKLTFLFFLLIIPCLLLANPLSNGPISGGDGNSGLPGGHDAVTLNAAFSGIFSLATQEIDLSVWTANRFLGGPTTGAAAKPTVRALVSADIPHNAANTSGSAATLSISGQTGLLSFAGITSTNRAKTVRDAADTLLELGGSYTPTGTWDWGSATWSNVPTLNQNTSGTAAGITGDLDPDQLSGDTIDDNKVDAAILPLDTDLSSVSGSDDTVPSAKATKAALDGKVNSSSTATFTEATGNALYKKTGAGAVGTSYIVPTGLTADRTVTFEDTDQTVANLAGTQTFTNKTHIAPLSTLPRVDGSTGLNLTAAQVSGTVIRNTGQALADVNHTLPTAAAGYNFVGWVGTALAATNYFRFTAATAGTMCLDGTCGKDYVTIDTPTQGASVTCYADQISSTGIKTGAALAIGSTNTAVANGAFEFDIAGTGYAKAATAAGTAPGNDVVPQGKYGVVAFDIGADGTIDAVEATDNATGYDSAALAIAGLPAVESAHTRMGYVTASKSDGDFTFGTTALDAANTTVVYTSSSAYVPPYHWICFSGAGTWTTD